jgi:DtxR family Mn-dependent transcriptional regulator
MENITNHTQNYLKTIYALVCSDSEASMTALARQLEIAPASVKGMLQFLAILDSPPVNYHKCQGATLTKTGEWLASEVICWHRFIETYRVRVLGYSWDAVHEEACRLEHILSEEFKERIAKALGDPQLDPHGELIPSAELVEERDTSIGLSKLRPPQKANVICVQTENQDLLRHLEKLRLRLGANLEVKDYSPFDENLAPSVEGQTEIMEGLPISSRIFVDTR